MDALAAYRLTRLVTEDTITKPLRDEIVDRGSTVPGFAGTGQPGRGWRYAAKLVECPWCAGFWIACGVTIARRVAPRVWEPVAVALATSAAVGALAEELG